LRESVQALVIVLVVPALPLFVLLLLDGEVGTLPVVVGMLAYCLGVFGITLFSESRKDRGLRGQVKFCVDEAGIYFGDSRERVPWCRVRSVVVRKNAGGASPVMADVVVVAADGGCRVFQYANRVQLRAALRGFAPEDVLVTDTVVTDPLPVVPREVKRRRRGGP
jgi:hypothetical protein